MGDELRVRIPTPLQRTTHGNPDMGTPHPALSGTPLEPERCNWGGARCPHRAGLRYDATQPDEDIGLHLSVGSFSELKFISTAWFRLERGGALAAPRCGDRARPITC